MTLGARIQVVVAMLAASAMAATPASASLRDFLYYHGLLGGGTSGGGAPEIDASAGLAAMALVACVTAIAYRKNRD